MTTDKLTDTMRALATADRSDHLLALIDESARIASEAASVSAATIERLTCERDDALKNRERRAIEAGLEFRAHVDSALKANRDELSIARADRDRMRFEIAGAMTALAAALPTRPATLAAGVDALVANIKLAVDQRNKAERDALRAKVAELEGVFGVGHVDDIARIARQRVEQRDAARDRVAELDARPVLDASRLAWALVGVPRDGRTLADIAADVVAKLGPVTLPAQDRAEELVKAWSGICTDPATSHLDPAERMRRALASIGALATTPAPAVTASPTVDDAEFIADKMKLYGWTIDRASAAADLRRAIAALPKRPTPAPADVFAAVSVDELARVSCDAYDGSGDNIADADRGAIRAVLAALRVRLVAPVDPEAVAKVAHDDVAWPLGLTRWSTLPNAGQEIRIDAMRRTLESNGIPVTPDVGK